MKLVLLFTTVVLVCQAALLPPEVATHDLVLVPSAPLPIPPATSSTEKSLESAEVPALVMEVNEDQEVIATTLTPETMKTMIPVDIELTTMSDPLMAMESQRQRRAVPFNDMMDQPKPQLATDLNVIREILSQRKPMMNDKMPAQRPMKSLAAETKSQMPINVEMVTNNPLIKSLDPAVSNIDPCDLLCTKFEFDPICATNGLCLHEFPNQCILDTYNCKHKNGKFSATKDDRCQMHWLTKCEESEMI